MAPQSPSAISGQDIALAVLDNHGLLVGTVPATTHLCNISNGKRMAPLSPSSNRIRFAIIALAGLEKRGLATDTESATAGICSILQGQRWQVIALAVVDNHRIAAATVTTPANLFNVSHYQHMRPLSPFQ